MLSSLQSQVDPAHLGLPVASWYPFLVFCAIVQCHGRCWARVSSLVQQHCTPKQWWGPSLNISKNSALPLCTWLVFRYLSPHSCLPVPGLGCSPQVDQNLISKERVVSYGQTGLGLEFQCLSSPVWWPNVSCSCVTKGNRVYPPSLLPSFLCALSREGVEEPRRGECGPLAPY